MIALVLLVIAAICFLLAALNVQTPINLIACGLLLFTIAMLVGGVAPRVGGYHLGG